MKRTLISIDPGMSTGIVVGTYSDTEPYQLKHFFQVEGGVDGFLANSFSGYDPGLGYDYTTVCGVRVDGATVIVEKFTARGEGNNFDYRTDALEALRVEGAILALRIKPTWVYPAQQYFASGESKSSVTNAHRWLKKNRDKGLYVTGGDVGCKNANDVRSAILHSIAYLRNVTHLPTIRHYFPEED